MAKLPYSNLVNSNPNPNSISKKKHFQVSNSQPAYKSPDDAYSYNQNPIEQNVGITNFSPESYISFDLSNCTKAELTQIRERLVAELDNIRKLNLRIESRQYNTQKKIRANPIAPEVYSKRLCPKLPILDETKMNNLMKMCKQVLIKLMKHKLSWVFNKSVDAAALGLHDYHHIIKCPMDLGTVKSNLGKNFYSSPADFAADVRLTFENALLYNSQGDEVHKRADQLLALFEAFYKPIEENFKIESRDIEIKEVQGSSWNVTPTMETLKILNQNQTCNQRQCPFQLLSLIRERKWRLSQNGVNKQKLFRKILNLYTLCQCRNEFR